MRGVRSFCFHVLAIAYYLCLAAALGSFRDGFGDGECGTKKLAEFSWRFFTVWCLALQAIYYSMALFDDVVGLRGHLATIKQLLFAGCVFPGTLFSTVAFWGLYLIDRELIYPKSMDEVVPQWLNHSLHTLPTVLVAMETVSVKQRHVAFNRCLMVLSCLNFAYYSVLFYTYFENGVWLYNIYSLLDWSQRLSYVAVNYSTSVALLTLYFRLRAN